LASSLAIMQRLNLDMMVDHLTSTDSIFPQKGKRD
jgi:hypothetical protein